MGVRILHSSKALGTATIPDSFTHSLYRLAPYTGCEHGCLYCDGRAERYFVEGQFERDIVIREDIPELLRAELPRLRESGIIGIGSGVTDPYQPTEGRVALVRRCAEQLARYPHGDDRQVPSLELYENHASPASPRLCAMVMTKSKLALRDLELWGRLNRVTGFMLLVSLTSLQEDIKEIFEPGASSFAERLDMICQFKEAGCVVGVLAMPLLPLITDSPESVEPLLRACASCGVDFFMPGGLTLRPGRQKTLFMSTLREHFPALVPHYERLYAEERPSGAPLTSYSAPQLRIWHQIQERYSLPWLLPHTVFAELLPPHDAFYILLQDMVELYRQRGVSVQELRGCVQRYRVWLTERRHYFRRHRRLPGDWLDGLVDRSISSGELAHVLDNPRLFDFLAAIARESARFNYARLKLE